MFAVIKVAGHQFCVKQGDEIVTNRVQGEPGDKINLDQVLMVGGDKTVIGLPLVAGAVVTAEIKEQKRADKIIVFKYKRRKNYKRTRGHRQQQSVLSITGITSN